MSSFADMRTEREIYYTDYENGIEYTDYHIHFEDSRWGLLFHPVRRGVRKLYTDGSMVGEKMRAVIGGMVDRRSRLIYDNPDGTYVVLWECEEVSK